MTEWLARNKVAAVEPAIAGFEHIAEQFLFRRLLIGITVKRVLFVHFHNQQSGFSHCHFFHRATRSANNIIFCNIIFHHSPCFVIARRPPTCFVKIEYIDESAIAFRSAVKFVNPVNAETIFESHPNVRPQAIAKYFDNIMIAVIGLFGLGQQIAQQFTYVAKGCRTMASAFVPKAAGTKLAPDSQRCAAHQCARQSQRKCIAVVKRKRTIKDIIACQVHNRLAHMRAAAKNFQMSGNRRLGQSRRAGGEYVITRVTQDQFSCFSQIACGLVGNSRPEICITGRHLIKHTIGHKQQFARQIFCGSSIQTRHIFNLLGADNQKFGVNKLQ